MKYLVLLTGLLCINCSNPVGPSQQIKYKLNVRILAYVDQRSPVNNAITTICTNTCESKSGSDVEFEISGKFSLNTTANGYSQKFTYTDYELHSNEQWTIYLMEDD